jgi:hypothetical protein
MFHPGAPEEPSEKRDPEAAFAICMNPINFGSAGPWSAEELAAMDAATIARWSTRILTTLRHLEVLR